MHRVWKELEKKYLRFYFIIQKGGIRNYCAKIVNGGKISPKILYENSGFALFVDKNDELGLLLCKNPTTRKVKRFLRDFSKSRGGIPRTCTFWTTSFK